MKSEFLFDAPFLSEKERASLSYGLMGLATSDLPLLAEILLVSEEEIRALNARERRTDRVTDVLSFPAMELVPEEPILSDEHGECISPSDGDGQDGDALFLGSVVVCEKRAREQAEEYGHSYERELFYLIVHGMLHLLGYDHIEETDRAVMREKEEYVMQKMNLSRNV